MGVPFSFTQTRAFWPGRYKAFATVGVVSPPVPGFVAQPLFLATRCWRTVSYDRGLLGHPRIERRSFGLPPTHVCHLVRLRSSIRAVPAYSLLIPSEQVSGPLCLSGPGVLPVPRNASHRPVLATSRSTRLPAGLSPAPPSPHRRRPWPSALVTGARPCLLIPRASGRPYRSVAFPLGEACS